jgi:hypothetical protein
MLVLPLGLFVWHLLQRGDSGVVLFQKSLVEPVKVFLLTRIWLCMRELPLLVFPS